MLEIFKNKELSNEEKAIMIADQCRPCSDDFYTGIKEGIFLALNAENENLKKAEKWDALGKQIDACYMTGNNEEDEEIDYDGDDMLEETGGDLVTIGELAAIAYGWL